MRFTKIRLNSHSNKWVVCKTPVQTRGEGNTTGEDAQPRRPWLKVCRQVSKQTKHKNRLEKFQIDSYPNECGVKMFAEAPTAACSILGEGQKKS